MVSNTYLDNVFKNRLSAEDEYGYYFYSMSFAPVGEYLLYGAFAPLLNKHLIVCLTKKRIILIELNPLTGNITENIAKIDIDCLAKIIVKRGMLKTKIDLVFLNGSSLRFKPNNICIGLSNHKNNLIKINGLYRL